MDEIRARRWGQASYALLFIAVLPTLLVLWARATEQVVTLPVVRAPLVGWAAAAVGLGLLALGMRALMVHGGGLPMNAYPPPRYVARGIYRYISQPIYVGFTLICAAASLVLGSASGLWLVCPAVAASATALVLGYERQDLERRFGSGLPRPLLALPVADDRAPGLWEKLSFYLLVVAPWLLAYQVETMLFATPVVRPPVPPIRGSVWIGQLAEWIQISSVVGLLLAPLLAGSNRHLRRLGHRGLWAVAIAGLLVALASLLPPAESASRASFIALPAIWSLLAATVFSRRLPTPLRPLAWTWAAAVCAACLITGRYDWIEVAGALGSFVVVLRIERIWAWLRQRTEHAANSWKEWHLGSVRVMSHGFYAGLAGLVGFLIMGALVPEAVLGDLFTLCVISLAGAGLWAQVIEGSSALLRPFGYYGAVIGAVVGAAVVHLGGGEAWPLLAAVSVAAPWMQAIGRVRCLIQGCCHGRACDAGTGIRYTHPRSRVVRLARLGGVHVHPTPLYSILWNAASGLLLLPLWFAGTLPLTFICGAYLMLNGLGRFVEESYRGEPQTPRKLGLPIYQWNAVASLTAGAALTCVGSGLPPVDPVFGGSLPALALAFGLITAAAMGVDFPRSNRRFSRLT